MHKLGADIIAGDVHLYKIIYLDTDMMMNGDIKELFDIDISNHELGVVLDRYGRWFLSPKYFNAGMLLMNMKNIYFVPFGQDNHKTKPNSMIADLNLLPEAIESALKGKQLQPIIR